MATETEAARDRVLAARAALGDELDGLEASARAAIDIPAKIKRSPAKAGPATRVTMPSPGKPTSFGTDTTSSGSDRPRNTAGGSSGALGMPANRTGPRKRG